MSSFNELLHRAEQHLRPENYDVCSILCGKTMELVLKELLQFYLQKTTQEEQLPVRKEIVSLRKRSYDLLTAGEMANVFEKCNILRSIISTRRIVMEDQRLPDLRTMVKIRNRATHDNANDSDLEKADAHVMYGSVLRLARVADQLLSQLTRKKPSEEAAATEREMAPRPQIDGVAASTRPMARGNMLTLYRNRSSGKYFVFLEEEDAEKILLVIPTGQIKALQRNLFESALEEEEKQAVSRGLILAEQAKCYHEYVGYATPWQKRGDETTGPKTPQIVDGKLVDDRKRRAGEVFTYEVHGAKASLVCERGAYIILKESTAVLEEKASITDSARRIRRDLLRKGILIPDKVTTRLKFTKDESFDSPSAASGVVSASSTNGWICFKLPNGKTLKHTIRHERE